MHRILFAALKPARDSGWRRTIAGMLFGLWPLIVALWFIAPTPPRVAAQGVLTAFDDFSNESSGWLIEDRPQRAFGYGAGGYFGRIKIANYGGYGFWTRSAADFDARVEVRRVGPNDGKNGAAYLAFRVTASARFYSFMLNDENKWCRFGKFGAGGEEYVDFDCKNHVKSYPEWNTLRVVAKGRDITFYVNDFQVGSVNDSTYSSGNFGLGAAALGDPMGYEVLFDNFALYQEGVPGIKTPTPSPTRTATATRTSTPVPAISPTPSATPRIAARTRTFTPTATPDELTSTPSPPPSPMPSAAPSATTPPQATPGPLFMPALFNGWLISDGS